MRRRELFAIALILVCASARAWAEDFIVLTTSTLRGDPSRHGWSTLRVAFRVQFPSTASGRKFLESRYAIVDAVERALERTVFDPSGGDSERAGLEQVLDASVRRSAPRGSVTRVYDFRIEATK